MNDNVMIFSLPECNLKCEYCRKDDVITPSPLSNYEIVGIAKSIFEVGIHKVRWTGGEPTVRKGFPILVRKLSDIGIDKQYLSTNGTLLYKIASELSDAGISRVNISLDTFDKEKFRKITGKDALEDVLKSIEIATKEFDLVKINSVLVSDNIDDVYKFIDYVSQFKKNKPIPRFLQLMKMEFSKELYSDKKLLTEEEVLKEFTAHYNSITPITNIESHNPFVNHYRIDKLGIVFGLVTCFAEEKEAKAPFKTLRINPEGFISNDIYSNQIYNLRKLSHGARVKVLEEILEDKKHHTKEWYEKSKKNFSIENMVFWRFGGDIPPNFELKN